MNREFKAKLKNKQEVSFGRFLSSVSKLMPVSKQTVYGNQKINLTYNCEELEEYANGSAKYTRYDAKTDQYLTFYYVER